jgi:hypothetical protein
MKFQLLPDFEISSPREAVRNLAKHMRHWSTTGDTHVPIPVKRDQRDEDEEDDNEEPERPGIVLWDE